ncbi:MAG: hypothetical protein Q9191_004831 [Dirinaria sp. TL-2023a]
METFQASGSPRAEELGARSMEIESVDAAAVSASTSTTIARSMSRYKGPRRNGRPSERSPPPKVPSLRQWQDPAKPTEDGVQGQGDAGRYATQKPHRNHRSGLADMPQSKDTVCGEQRDELPHATMATPTDAFERKMRLVKEQEGRIMRKVRPADAPGEQESAGTELAMGIGGDITTLKGIREEARSARPGNAPGTSSGKAASSASQPAVKGDTVSSPLGSSSQPLAVQAPRPQAFKQGSSREELKKMISAPISPEEQEATPIPCVPVPQPHNDAVCQDEAQEHSLAPRFDAPISAVNAGQRIVRVKYEGSDLFLPVNPSTTPVDMIRAARRQLSAPIDEKSTVVLESFKQVGLERPIRKYEHLRDVLNSWDNDAQNILVIIPSPSGGKDDDLDALNVSKDQPGETSVYMYYSQKPGSWDKRWVTLRSDGQMVVAKKNRSETCNICHLSDFDIYIPTPRYASKKIKPPKKVCFAVKSQQKSSVFMTTKNFVHFFCTNDRQLGTTWYKAVQEWRSWYLVNVMGEGQKGGDEKGMKSSGRRNSISGAQASRHPQHPSIERNGRPQSGPYISTMPKRQLVAHDARPAHPTKLTKDPYNNAPTTHRSKPTMYQTPAAHAPAKEPFDPASLLGRTYTQRQQAQQQAHQQAQLSDPEPPPPLPVSSARDQSPGKSVAANGLKRHSSTRQKPKPLVDLTPVYQEPPQHSKKGRGHIPSHIPAGGLVEVATSPENPLDIPSATTWRKLHVQAAPPASSRADDAAFTGGLLGRSGTRRFPLNGKPG